MDPQHRKRKLSTFQAKEEAAQGFGDQDPNQDVAPCSVAKQPKVDVEVWPVLDIAHPVVLRDRRYRVTYAGSQAPTPTPTRLDLSLDGAPGYHHYAGQGTLTVTAGQGRLYTDAQAQHPIGGLPYQRTADQLRAGVTLYALGDQVGALTLRLALTPAAGFVVGGPAQVSPTVVELTLTPHSYVLESRALTEQRKIRNGQLAAVAAPGGYTQKTEVVVSASNPAVAGSVLRVSRSAGRVRLLDGNAPPADQVGQNLQNQQTTLNLEGSQAGAAVWVSLGLVLQDGTHLQHGDCFRAIPVDQPATSVGFEWEIKALHVDRRFQNDRYVNAGSVLDEEAWEGAPSKVTVYSRGGGAMKLDTEVSAGLHPYTYGEFVLGPARTYAELETQLGYMKDFIDVVKRHRKVRTAVPADIPNRNVPGSWMQQNDHVAVELMQGGWRGTAQASVGLPLFLLPAYLAAYGGVEGVDAQRDAEDAAEGATAVDHQVMGLIAAVRYYARLFLGRAAIHDDDGPKVATPIMFRSDFHSMWASLSGAQQNAFRVWAQARPNRAQRLLPHGYSTGGGGFQNQGPTLGEWLDSIEVPDHGKDALSPPPGFARHHTNPAIPYGMGVMGLDNVTGNVVSEYRAFAANPGYNAFCHEVFRWADVLMLPGNQTWEKSEITQEWGPHGQGLAPHGPAVAYTLVP